jgi:hypothetical protein
MMSATTVLIHTGLKLYVIRETECPKGVQLNILRAQFGLTFN